MFLRAVAVDKASLNVDDPLALPVHGQARFRGDRRHRGRLQILRPGERDKAGNVFSRHDDRHALLRFADGELRSVESIVFHGYAVEIDRNAVRKLPDGN